MRIRAKAVAGLFFVVFLAGNMALWLTVATGENGATEGPARPPTHRSTLSGGGRAVADDHVEHAGASTVGANEAREQEHRLQEGLAAVKANVAQRRQEKSQQADEADVRACVAAILSSQGRWKVTDLGKYSRGLEGSTALWGLMWTLLTGFHTLVLIGDVGKIGGAYTHSFVRIVLVEVPTGTAASDTAVATATSGIKRADGSTFHMEVIRAGAIEDESLDGVLRRTVSTLGHPVVWLAGYADAPPTDYLERIATSVGRVARPFDAVMINVARLTSPDASAIPTSLSDTQQSLRRVFRAHCMGSPVLAGASQLSQPMRSEADFRIDPVALMADPITSKVPLKDIPSPMPRIAIPTPIDPSQADVSHLFAPTWPAEVQRIERIRLNQESQPDDHYGNEPRAAAERARALSPPLVPDPALVRTISECTGRDETSVDFVLFTRNRPLHTFAFIDSALRFLRGVNTIWVIYTANAEPAILNEGYTLAQHCFEDDNGKRRRAVHSDSASTRVRFVRQRPSDSGGFHDTLTEDVLAQSTAGFVSLVVDEILFIRSFDLTAFTCLLHADPSLGGAQIRLGKGVSNWGKAVPHSRWVYPSLARGESLFTYLPVRQMIPYAYLMNVDGALVRRERLLRELRSVTFQQPMALEQTWLRVFLRDYQMQWTLAPEWPIMVNNNDKLGGRVMASATVADGLVVNARALVADKKVLDVAEFKKLHKFVRRSHEAFDVSFVPLSDSCALD